MHTEQDMQRLHRSSTNHHPMTENLVINKKITIPSSELHFRYSRSSGPGGQNVNKLSTKAELVFDLANSSAIDGPTKARLLDKLANIIDSAGVLTVTSQESRSQYQNRQIATEKFVLLLKKALVVPKARKRTKPTRTSNKKRLDSKIKRGAIKKTRRTKFEAE
jgi:ribosome-associated protein